MQNLSINYAVDNAELKTFWNLREEYMIRDVFTFDEFGDSLTAEDKEWLLSFDYCNHMNSHTIGEETFLELCIESVENYIRNQ